MEDQKINTTPTGVNGNTVVLDRKRLLIRPHTESARRTLQLEAQENIGKFL